ncbi:MAG: PorP/SprF family type IX secretion system membrane protein [Crocinitomicaceae bacterium]
MKKIIYISIAILSSTFTFAQQETQLTQFFINPYLYNPAAGGTSSLIDLNLGFRQQWTGIQGAPMTIYGSGTAPVRFGKKGENVVQSFKPEKTFFSQPEVTTGIIKHVLGGKFMSTSVGPFNKTSLGVSYAFHFPLVKSINMSFGVSAGYSNFGLNTSRVSLYQTEDNAYNTLLSNSGNQNIFDMQAGLFIYNKHFQFGYSATQLIQNKLELSKITTNSNLNMHHFIFATGTFDIGKNLQLSPGIFMSMVKNAPFNIEGSLRLMYNRMAWFMVGYKNSNTLSLGIGANLFKCMRIGYSFDIGVSKLRSINNSSHEITLGFIIGKNKVSAPAPVQESSAQPASTKE